MATSHEHDELLSIGKQCSHSSCMLVDFLPFECQHCSQAYCQEHFMVNAHSCPNYDESKHNRVAPNCPLCNVPVAIPPGQDPNARMEDHFAKECSVMTGRRAKKSSPVCARGICGKILIAPIRCDKCREQFCPAHRFPVNHNCTPTAPTTKPRTTPSWATGAGAALNSNAKVLNTKATAAGTAAMGAIKKNISSTTSSGSAAKPSAPSPASTNPFSKTDRRAKAERESRRKAMEARAKKGLLSDEEKLKLATLEAERAKQGTEKKDCVIM